MVRSYANVMLAQIICAMVHSTHVLRWHIIFQCSNSSTTTTSRAVPLVPAVSLLPAEQCHYSTSSTTIPAVPLVLAVPLVPAVPVVPTIAELPAVLLVLTLLLLPVLPSNIYVFNIFLIFCDFYIKK